MTCHPFLERYITISISRSLKKPEREGNWTQSTVEKTSRTVIRNREKKMAFILNLLKNTGIFSFHLVILITLNALLLTAFHFAFAASVPAMTQIQRA